MNVTDATIAGRGLVRPAMSPRVAGGFGAPWGSESVGVGVGWVGEVNNGFELY